MSLMLVCEGAYFDALELDSPKIAEVDSGILVAHVAQLMQQDNPYRKRRQGPRGIPSTTFSREIG